MLTYSTASIFDSPHQTLVNPVNTVGSMGAGLALEFRDRFPRMFEQYKRDCEAGKFRGGGLVVYTQSRPWVLNFPTKEHWRERSNLRLITDGLRTFVMTYASRKITSVAFPRLGSGLGGLEWTKVKPLMEQYLAQLPIPVTIHVPE